MLKRFITNLSIATLPLVCALSAAFAEGEGPAVPAGSAPAGAPGAAQQPGVGGMLIPMIAIFAVMYFMMIRPQQKRMKEQQAMIAALQMGEDVVTTSGIIGKVAGLTEKVVTLEVADGVKIKVLKSQIAQVLKGQIKDLT